MLEYVEATVSGRYPDSNINAQRNDLRSGGKLFLEWDGRVLSFNIIMFPEKLNTVVIKLLMCAEGSLRERCLVYFNIFIGYKPVKI